MIDVARALMDGEAAEVTRPTKAGVSRGWQVARSIIHERVPMWCLAAGVDPPQIPDVRGFDDLPAIFAALSSIPTYAAIHADPATRMAGAMLAERTQLGPLRAVETALGHARYDSADERRLCDVQVEVERVLRHLATLAVARHHAQGGTAETFDLGPWTQATETLAEEL